jgi:hypothetical protein
MSSGKAANAETENIHDYHEEQRRGEAGMRTHNITQHITLDS